MTPPTHTSSSPLLSKIDWVAAGIVFLSSLCLYTATLAPSVTLEHSGSLIVAGQYMGVGRVPGYPLWHLCAKLFTSLFWFAQYRGHPNPAWALNFMSAFFGSLSCGLLTLLASRIGRALLLQPAQPEQPVMASLSAIIAGICFSFSHIMWSQSVITETHTLTLFLILACLSTAIAWLVNPSHRLAGMLALLLGIAMAQSLFTILVLPPLLLAIALRNLKLFRDLLITATPPTCIMFVLINISAPVGVWPGLGFALLTLLSLIVAAFFLPHGRVAATMVTLTLLGLSLYLYLPLAGYGHPPMYFGNPATWDGFIHCIMRGQYERIVPTNIFQQPLLFFQQMKDFVWLMRQQFFLPLLLLAFLPIARIRSFPKPWPGIWGVLLFALFMFTVVVVIGANPKGDIQDSFIQRVKFIPATAIFSLFIAQGILMSLHFLYRCAADKTEP